MRWKVSQTLYFAKQCKRGKILAMFILFASKSDTSGMRIGEQGEKLASMLLSTLALKADIVLAKVPRNFSMLKLNSPTVSFASYSFGSSYSCKSQASIKWITFAIMVGYISSILASSLIISKYLDSITGCKTISSMSCTYASFSSKLFGALVSTLTGLLFEFCDSELYLLKPLFLPSMPSSQEKLLDIF